MAISNQQSAFSKEAYSEPKSVFLTAPLLAADSEKKRYVRKRN